MNKAQFIEALATRLDTDRRAAQTYLDAVFDQIYATVSKGEEVVLTGFGKFEKRDRAARTARNPATGAPVRVKKTSVPGFKAGTEFKAIVSGAKKIAKAPAKKVTKAAPVKRTTTAAKKAAPVKKAVAAKKAAPVKKVAAKKVAPAKKAPAKKVARKTAR